MATNTMVPYSNPAGNNQTTPGAGSGVIPSQSGMPGGPIGVAVSPTASASNPLVPTAGLPGTTTSSGIGTNSQQSKQLDDIYGKGVGGDLNTLLNSIGGVDSATLQQYIASLQPQEATAQANLNASLGAGGVGSNSSVAALGDANLNAQETGMIAGESASLLQSGQNLEASILQGMEPAATAEVSQSGWNVLGDVLQDAGGIAGDVLGLGAVSGGFGGGGSVPLSQFTSGQQAGTPVLEPTEFNPGVPTSV